MYEFRLIFFLKFVPKGPINNVQAFVQIMAWRRPGTVVTKGLKSRVLSLDLSHDLGQDSRRIH